MRGERIALPLPDQKPISRGQAILGGRQYFYTGKLCMHGHLSLRRTRDNSCIECRRQRAYFCKYGRLKPQEVS